jgi:hypothetical protein
MEYIYETCSSYERTLLKVDQWEWGRTSDSQNGIHCIMIANKVKSN